MSQNKPRILAANGLSLQSVSSKATVTITHESYMNLMNRLDALERYVSALDKTYIITDPVGNVVKYEKVGIGVAALSRSLPE
jgi:hypothetical protein